MDTQYSLDTQAAISQATLFSQGLLHVCEGIRSVDWTLKS